MFERVLVTGAAGMLGSAIVPYFNARCKGVIATDLKWGNLDVRNKKEVKNLFSNYKPDLVLHLAAITDLEECETNTLNAYDTNAEGTYIVAGAVHKYDAKMVYISTAGVFDGKKDSYTEEDHPNPINVYGKTKFAGEAYMTWFTDYHYMVRAGWMTGGGIRDHKFVSYIRDQIKAGAKVIHAVNDKFGTPTYTKDFAANLWAVLETKQYGTYHMVNQGNASRYDVAKEIARVLKFDGEVIPVPSSHFEDKFWVPRPRSEQLVNAKLEQLGINHMRPWQDALEEYLTSWPK